MRYAMRNAITQTRSKNRIALLFLCLPIFTCLFLFVKWYFTNATEIIFCIPLLFLLPQARLSRYFTHCKKENLTLSQKRLSRFKAIFLVILLLSLAYLPIPFRYSPTFDPFPLIIAFILLLSTVCACSASGIASSVAKDKSKDTRTDLKKAKRRIALAILLILIPWIPLLAFYLILFFNMSLNSFLKGPIFIAVPTLLSLLCLIPFIRLPKRYEKGTSNTLLAGVGLLLYYAVWVLYLVYLFASIYPTYTPYFQGVCIAHAVTCILSLIIGLPLAIRALSAVKTNGKNK